jgi:CheY-like chemotaxis protein/pSer/pThr/pTyr-binding forkhead associated (FHA) protein
MTEQAQSMTDSNLWVVELTGPEMSQPLKLRLEKPLVIGRSVVGETRQPDVDLSPFGAEKFGVSRQHVKIFSDDSHIYVTDLESGNGTFLNKDRLKPMQAYAITHDDHLMLGRMGLDFKVIISPSHSGGLHKQPSLQLQDQPHPGTGQMVMIVEDDEAVANVMTLMMERAGYTVRAVHDVVSAIRAFNQKRPDAIILDMMLTDMNGLEFCRYVRRDVRHNTTPIIVVSAAAAPTNVMEAMAAGADIFLNKPVSANELRHVVASLMEQRERGDSSIHTKHLVGTAPLKATPPESRRDSVVLFVAGYSDAPLTLTIPDKISFGRTTNTGKLPNKSHVDLSRFDAVNYGVSRVHMWLHNKGGKFFLEDANTVNGTYLNGDPVKPGELIPLKNADEIRLGQLRMYIYFLEDGQIG